MNTPLEAHLKDMDSFFYGENRWQAGLYALIKDLTIEQVVWKPSPDRHCIWEVVKHVLFWKLYATATFLEITKPDWETGNWAELPPSPSEKSWKLELENLKNSHEELKNVVKNFGDELFNIQNKRSNYIREMTNHDSYHAGQIGLLRVMQGLKPIE